jgi:hypothetical protein
VRESILRAKRPRKPRLERGAQPPIDRQVYLVAIDKGDDLGRWRRNGHPSGFATHGYGVKVAHLPVTTERSPMNSDVVWDDEGFARIAGHWCYIVPVGDKLRVSLPQMDIFTRSDAMAIAARIIEVCDVKGGTHAAPHLSGLQRGHGS